MTDPSPSTRPDVLAAAPPEAPERFGRAGLRTGEEATQLVRGAGRFTDDAAAEAGRAGAAWGVFVRSDHAHGVIRGLDAETARSAPGVLAVLTASDLAQAGIGPILTGRLLEGRDGRAMTPTPWPSLAQDRVRHVGQPIALVVAETLDQALDAAEMVSVEIEALPAVAEVTAAVAAGAPELWPFAPGNVALDWAAGDQAAVAEAMEQAAHVTRIRLVNNRLAPASLEPRSVLATWDGETGRYTLVCGSQSAAALHAPMAAMMGLAPDRLRVLTPQVGGGFGSKTAPYPEYAPLLLAARLAGRPVRWRATRNEAFLTDIHARDSIIEGALALDADGRFLGLDVRATAALGAYVSPAGPIVATLNTKYCLAGMYRTPAIHLATRLVFTNTVPTGPYRGAGRPEAAFILERLVDQAARETGRDPVELRRLNLIPPFRERHTTPLGDATTAATTGPSSTRRWRSPTGRAFPPAARRHGRAAACAASASPASSRRRAPCRPRRRSSARWPTARSRC